MRVNVGQAKTDLSKLLAVAEAGGHVEIARHGVPVVKLVPIRPADRPAARFLGEFGALAGEIELSDDFEFSAQELDEILDHPA